MAGEYGDSQAPVTKIVGPSNGTCDGPGWCHNCDARIAAGLDPYSNTPIEAQGSRGTYQVPPPYTGLTSDPGSEED